MSTLIELRRRELDRRQKGLRTELKAWTERTQSDPLRRHLSQVARVSETLNGLLSVFENDPKWKNPDDAAVMERGAAWEMLILTAYSAWDVFREKLALRLDHSFRDLLVGCDDLMWECYEPAMSFYSPGKPKQPPLVYLSSTWSPVLRKRDSRFQDEVRVGLDASGEALHHPACLETIQKLPIPLLGLPWFQVAHLPGALLIGHEVGHAVEFDFQLTDVIKEALRNARLTERYEWIGCAREVFADLYGCLSLRKYGACAMLNINVTSRDAAQDPGFGLYPPRALRIRLLVCALEHLDLPDDAKYVRDLWEATYGALPESIDVDKVVTAIYTSSALQLRSYLKPPAGNIERIARLAVDNHANLKLETNARDLFCAARHIHETGTPAELDAATPRLLDQIVNGHAGQYRYRGKAVANETDLKSQMQHQLLADRQAGIAWLKELGFD